MSGFIYVIAVNIQLYGDKNTLLFDNVIKHMRGGGKFGQYSGKKRPNSGKTFFFFLEIFVPM